MQRVVTRLPDKEKEDWQNLCRSRNMTESDMLRTMIKQVSGGQGREEDPGPDEKKTEKITIRISGRDKYRIIKRANQEGYPSRTSWVTSLVLAALHRQPVLSHEEITSLRESNRQLAAIGRNLNQLVRALNTDARALARINRADIKDLAGQIEEHKAKVAELLDRNLNRWGNGDE